MPVPQRTHLPASGRWLAKQLRETDTARLDADNPEPASEPYRVWRGSVTGAKMTIRHRSSLFVSAPPSVMMVRSGSSASSRRTHLSFSATHNPRTMDETASLARKHCLHQVWSLDSSGGCDRPCCRRVESLLQASFTRQCTADNRCECHLSCDYLDTSDIPPLYRYR